MNSKSKKNELSTKSWMSPNEILSWVEANPLLKSIARAVPNGILPLKYSGTLYDIRVQAPRHQSDDSVYEENPQIRALIPRGLCIFKLINPSGETTYYRAVTGMKKFTGGLFDEDDSDVTNDQMWKNFFIKPIEETVIVLKTSKENGESAHFSPFLIDGQFYYFLGSKQVHMLVSKPEHVALYDSEQRYGVAKIVANAFFVHLKSLLQEKMNLFINYMWENKLSATFEMLQPQYQHVEFFDFPEIKLRFITFTSNEYADGICLNPVIGVEKAKEVGFETIQFEQHTLQELEIVSDNIRSEYGKEGAVLYFIDKSNQVIGLLKKKTRWYILCRAVREKMKMMAKNLSQNPENINDIKEKQFKKTTVRLSEIQKWLGLSDDIIKLWTQLATSFMEWLAPKIVKNQITSETVDSLFPVLWRDFLIETKQIDH